MANIRHEPDRFLEHSSKKRLVDKNNLFNEFRVKTQKNLLKIQIWMIFPVIGSAHDPKIKISKKYWMSFPEIGQARDPEKTEISEKFMDEFSRIRR